MTVDCGLRPITETDSDMLLEWRNTPSIRQFMYSSHIIKPEEHQQWYNTIQNDSDRHPLVFLRNNIPSGFVNIGPIKPGGIAEWGFYAAPNSPRGTGKLLGSCVLEYAFCTLCLHKLCGEAVESNIASQRLHSSLGFRKEGELIDQFFDGHTYYTIVKFGLTAHQWTQLTTRDSDE